VHYVGGKTDAAIVPTTPENLTVFVGMSVKFGCETDTGSTIRWNFFDPRNQRLQVLYSGSVVAADVALKITVNPTARGNEIIVRNVSVDDSGEYRCHEVEKFSRKFTFYMEVKGTLLLSSYFTYLDF